MKRLFVLVIALAFALAAQEGAAVNQTIGPPQIAYTALNTFSGANLIYTCTARAVQPTFTWTKAATTVTNIIDSGTTSTVLFPAAHGLSVGNAITISGIVTAGGTALNATFYVQTVPLTTTVTITTAGVTDATYTDSGLTVATTAPRDTAAIWSIQKFTYSGANQIAAQYANGNPGMVNICANQAVTTGTTKTVYQ